MSRRGCKLGFEGSAYEGQQMEGLLRKAPKICSGYSLDGSWGELFVPLGDVNDDYWHCGT